MYSEFEASLGAVKSYLEILKYSSRSNSSSELTVTGALEIEL